MRRLFCEEERELDANAVVVPGGVQVGLEVPMRAALDLLEAVYVAVAGEATAL